MEAILKRIRAFEIFSHVDRRLLVEFSASINFVNFPNKEIVFKKGDPIEHIYLVVTGSVKIQDTVPVDKTKIFNFLGRGEFLGVAMAGLPKPVYPATAICIEDSSFLKIPLSILFQMILRVPKIRSEVNRQISERFLEFQNDIGKAHRLTTYRLADFILRLADRQTPELRRVIQIPLIRSDIAQRIGAESETVIRIMSQWTKIGWIRTTDRHIEILNRTALEGLDTEILNAKRSRSNVVTEKLV